MEDVFRLRFQVYCEEKMFLPREAYPHGLEIDEFDDQATHIAVYGDDHLPKGYLRVVVARDHSELPLFAHGMTVGAEFPLPAPGGAVEISRMMVRSDYRKRLRAPDDGFPQMGLLADPPARSASDLIQLKLIRLAYRHALASDVRWFLSAIEPAQGRKLSMMGFPIRPIGPVGDYFGNVRPHAVDLREMETKLRENCPEVWAFFCDPAEDVHTRVIRPGEWKMPASLLAA
ncbi:PEP-CTERM/exosortase system-associated acyltransferase [Agrobacterium salinitolerans]|nr:PEP-CTERM/exosortase system-associated acyltransferase [Agrobacterium salinitolerans]